MQHIYHMVPSEDVPRSLRQEELAAARSSEGWVWLDVTGVEENEVAAVGEMFGLDSLSVSDILDVTLLPKIDHHDEYVYVVLHGVDLGEDGRLRTEELDIFIGERYLVTAHRQPMASVDFVASQMATSSRLAACGPAGIAAAIAEAGSRRYLPLLDALDDRIEALEDHAMAADPRTLSESQALRHDVIMLRRTLGPQREVLHQLSSSSSRVIEDSSRAFRDVYDHYFRLVESLDAARALLGVVLDTYRGAVAERTNEVMKVLTVFSVIMLPLTLIAGIWGMNFADLPGSDARWGFTVLLATMATLGGGLWAYFVRRGFVGGPKLREIPKSVGLGLVHMGAAPLRAVTGLLPNPTRNHGAVPAPADDPLRDPDQR